MDLALAAACVGGLWTLGVAWTFASLHRRGKAFPELAPGAHPSPPADAPRITVVVAMKDEETNAAGCVESVLSQDYPDLRLIVVDDRSSDGTTQALAELAERHERLRVIRQDAVPEGWGGQNHGLHRGASAADGEWLCFTDADCRFESPQAISLAWQDAVAAGAEFLSLLPRMEAPTLRERSYLPLTSLLFMLGLDVPGTNDPSLPDSASAYGPFMLIRRDAYQRLGGHPRVSGQINGDVALARLAKREGVPFRLAGNRGIYHTRMYRSLGAAWSGWTRNFRHSIQRPRTLARLTALALALFVVPWPAFAASLVLATGDPGAWPAAAAWGVAALLTQAGLARLYGALTLHPAWSLTCWPGGVFSAAICARAWLAAALGQETTWHGVRYGRPTRLPAREKLIGEKVNPT